jgi:hypothetical protein
MKRILLAIALLITSQGVYAQKAEKATTFDEVKVEQKSQVMDKYNQIVSLLDKKDYAGAKLAYAAAEQLMTKSLEADKKFLRKAKTEDERTQMQNRMDSKARLMEASKPFATADLAVSGKRYAVYIMEFANVSGW